MLFNFVPMSTLWSSCSFPVAVEKLAEGVLVEEGFRQADLSNNSGFDFVIRIC